MNECNNKCSILIKISKYRKMAGLTQQEFCDLLDIQKSSTIQVNSENIITYIKFIELFEYLNDKVNGREFVLKDLFHINSIVFDSMNAIEFSKAIGREGLNEVYSQFKRMYG